MSVYDKTLVKESKDSDSKKLVALAEALLGKDWEVIPSSGSSSSSASTSVPRALALSKPFLRDHLLRSRKLKSATMKSVAGKFNVVVGGVTNTADVKTGAAGVSDLLLGFNLMSASADFPSWSNLFDVFRVRKIHVGYAARLPLALTAGTTHQPFVWAYRPDDAGASTFVLLSVSCDYGDKKTNVLTSTGVPDKFHSFHCPPASAPVFAGTTTLTPTVSDWCNTGLSTINGGVQTCVRVDTSNVSVTLGTFFVTWETEWAYRV